jgi:hypothetical protein
MLPSLDGSVSPLQVIHSSWASWDKYVRAAKVGMSGTGGGGFTTIAMHRQFDRYRC